MRISVRIGYPSTYGDVISGYRSPDYATATGLAFASSEKNVPNGKSSRERASGDAKKKIWDSIKNFAKELF